MAYRRLGSDDDWSAERVAGLPSRWRHRILTDYDGRRASVAPDARRESNLHLLKLTDALNAVRLPLGANDGVICDRAAELAGECSSIAEVFPSPAAARAAMARIVTAHQCEAPAAERVDEATGEIRGVRDMPAIKRMTDPLWWRRALRKMHARHVEGAAIGLGYVAAGKDMYVSDESVARRTQQRARNAAMLEKTIARNEDGDEFTLADLASRGPANKAIRRAELMTRIAGFEHIARDLKHVGLFFTITCPSRMHKWRKAGSAGARLNPLYDGTTPGDAQRHLSRTFARLRAKLARVGVQWYGFRIAEPNHDGTPHWHVLVFFAGEWRGDGRRAALPRVCALVRRYALQDSPGERGAKKHRADFEPIDWSKGSAAGYIAKYVAKNIDGYKVGDDLYGNPAIESSARVEAWAATWRIRQFQQVGGPPVGVWRELRRVADLPVDAPAALVQAHGACNKVERVEGAPAAVSWAAFVVAAGGVSCARDRRPIRLFKEHDEREGRYGEAVGAVVRGVRAWGVVTYRDGIVMRERLIEALVRSVRHVWTIVSARVSGLSAGIARPWTRVNNCTGAGGGVAADDPGIIEWIKEYDWHERRVGLAFG